MKRLGLALSGGGFRATLYHLGIVRYLKDVGRLDQVTDIASVSGGSILAAHLVLNWDRYNGSDSGFDEAAAEIVKFVQFDVRNHIVRRMPLQYPLRFLAKVLPLDQNRLTPNAILERYYETHLYGDRRLYELPARPALHILTTNISNGGLSVFNRQGLYIQQRGDLEDARFEHIPGQMASISRVVGASSAFPGLFPPVRITASDLGVREGQFSTEWFTDGGVYDNLGIRAFSWLKQQDAQFDQIIVSDAGKPFQILCDASLGFVGQSVRATDILWDRVWQLERQNFGERPGFLFLPITESVSESDDPKALHPVVQAEVQSIRTDLDHFSDVEVNALVQHGYEVARKICSQNDLGSDSQHPSTPWTPIRGATTVTPAVDSFEPSKSTKTSLELRKSSRRRTLSTVLNPRDWTSYVYVAIALFAFVYVPYQVYKLRSQSNVQAMVLRSIAKGDPDIQKILDLVNSDPSVDWVSGTIEEKDQGSKLDYSAIDVQTYSRIIDLRRSRSKAKDGRGSVYVWDTVNLRLSDDYDGDRQVSIAFPLPSVDLELNQQGSQIQGRITRVKEPLIEYDEVRTVYELDYDFSPIPRGEKVTLKLAGRLSSGYPMSRPPFLTRVNIDLVTVWVLFPSDEPYQNYSLVRYPADRSKPPELMESRYSIDHPYGSLIGWSVVNAQPGIVYECRWTTEGS